MSTEFVRLTLPNGNYAQWIDHGPERPALVNWYTQRGGFACIDQASYDANETTAQAIQRLTALHPDAELSRLTLAQVHPEYATPQTDNAQQPQTGTEEGQNPC